MKIVKTCISCPRGCRIEIETDKEGEAVGISGNSCARGRDYAVSEMKDPRRTITAVVRTASRILPCLPVRTDKPLPIGMTGSLLRRLDSVFVEMPAKAGDAVLRDFEGTGVNVLLTRGAAK